MRRLLMVLLLAFAFGLGSGATPWTLTILHTNDTHSQLENMARQATLVQEIQLQVPNVILLHAGDAVLGTLYYTVHKGLAEAWVLREMGFTAMTLGNHEFNEGPAGLAKFADAVGIPLLSANFDFTGEPLLVGKVLPYIVVEVGEGRWGSSGSPRRRPPGAPTRARTSGSGTPSPRPGGRWLSSRPWG